ncbi:MAG: carbohydrate ABC transporter permease [Candidatus Limnocylindrales bacterium]
MKSTTEAATEIAAISPRRFLPPVLKSVPYYVLSGAAAVVFLFPLAWATFASVNGTPGSTQTEGFGVGNYTFLWDWQNGLPTYFFNTVILACGTVVITLTVSLLGGYAFARFDFPLRNTIFMMTLAILMVPVVTLLIPLLVLLKFLGIQDSLLGVALVMSMFQLPFATFMMRVSMEAVPRELEEAAQVDGAGTFDVFRRIILPSVRPGMVTVALFAFLAAWNDFITPLILIATADKEPLAVALTTMREQTIGIINYGSLEAGVVVMALPCLILFFALQGQYVRGFMSGAIKG